MAVWVNEMLTIWLFGTLGSLVLIGAILWLWYSPRSSSHSDEDDDRDV